ncbi:hypothetical protein SERLADRAFT_403853 [Serpula lacrymans var. lacrymans S7.9]|uniref:Uncharacterized protein n=1 Tax=Serpula lacrymans var. lacrymans (strain S7.9) TaxID=578457 RepID=F8PDZ6_SERL9|nr:uncharacterized protein SERLADRAFT_403853 [Serpula lacrymans var. lacrymans S7.9]EGO18593.1 hypothetical protein SERLADRAFT_403853 [Serpula lacrymans var. lacrymans S7.9]
MSILTFCQIQCDNRYCKFSSIHPSTFGSLEYRGGGHVLPDQRLGEGACRGSTKQNSQ